MEDFEFYKAAENKDEGVYARFYDKYEKTDEINGNGLPVFEPRTWVEIKIKDSYDVVDNRATREHINRFPNAYNLYLTKKEKLKEGTPLTMFAFLNPAQIECCDIRGIYTVEALAGLDKEKALSIGLTEEAELARKFIELQNNNKDIKAYEDKIKELENTIIRLENELNAYKETK